MPLSRTDALKVIERGEGYLHTDGRIYTSENVKELPGEADFALALEDPRARAAAAEAAEARLKDEVRRLQDQLSRLQAGTAAGTGTGTGTGPAPAAKPPAGAGPTTATLGPQTVGTHPATGTATATAPATSAPAHAPAAAQAHQQVEAAAAAAPRAAGDDDPERAAAEAKEEPGDVPRDKNGNPLIGATLAAFRRRQAEAK